MAEVAVAFDNIGKCYGTNTVLDAVSFSVRAGEIHGIVGENGAGKSTLIKIISGATSMSSGQLYVFGESQKFRNSLDAQAIGIQTVFQELTLIPDLSVAKNLFNVRRLGTQLQRVSGAKLSQLTKSLFDLLKLDLINPWVTVRELPLYSQQLLEIAKALSARPRLLILDEATSALLAPHVEWLYQRVQDFKNSGGTVIFTSHRWDEVKKFTDRISVMRNGKIIDTLNTEIADEMTVTKMMTGKSLDLLFPKLPEVRRDVALRVSALNTSNVHDVSFELHQGEILGVGGLSGQGQRDLFLAMFGAVRFSGSISGPSGEIEIKGPRDAINAGFGLVPEDRKFGGVAGNLTIRDNVVLPILSRYSKRGLINFRSLKSDVDKISTQLRIQGEPFDLVSTLSGGNQQKVVLAKWLTTNSSVLLLYDVTRGVDVGTKYEIYKWMIELAQEGKAILFYSTETTEVVHLSHRVMVFYEGRIRSILQGETLSLESVVGSSVGTAIGGLN